jgi:CheY-like chemotaxis protein
MKRILIVDDTPGYAEHLKDLFLTRYGGDKTTVEICRDPLTGLKLAGPEWHLILVDLEMPVLDGRKFLDAAVSRGANKKRIIILSAREAEHLHDLVPAGCCLAVINKTEERQQEALLMMVDSIMRKAETA